MTIDFTGRKAIICGGNRGIGRAIALGGDDGGDLVRLQGAWRPGSRKTQSLRGGCCAVRLLQSMERDGESATRCC